MNKGKIFIAKPGLDGHDRGAKYVARILREEGFDVIYSGIRRTPEEIAMLGIEHDVEVIGLSILSGSHNELCPAVLAAVTRLTSKVIPVIVGGTIPEKDVHSLKKIGIFEVFPTGTHGDVIVRGVREVIVAARKEVGQSEWCKRSELGRRRELAYVPAKARSFGGRSTQLGISQISM